MVVVLLAVAQLEVLRVAILYLIQLRLMVVAVAVWKEQGLLMELMAVQAVAVLVNLVLELAVAQRKEIQVAQLVMEMLVAQE